MNAAIREAAGRVVDFQDEDVELGPLTQEEKFPWETEEDVVAAQKRQLNRELRGLNVTTCSLPDRVPSRLACRADV
jgi:hypothetical protein